MRKLKLLFGFVLAETVANAQNGKVDSLHVEFAGANNDSKETKGSTFIIALPF